MRCRHPILTLAAWLIAAGAVLGAAVHAPPDAPVETSRAAAPVPPKLKVLHLRLLGDLTHVRVARDFAAAISSCHDDGVDAIVLEINGNRWRSDVLLQMARACIDAKLMPAPGSALEKERAAPRLIVWLNDPADDRVSSAAATFALFAQAAYVGPKLEVAHDPSDESRDLAPPDVDWARIEEDLRAIVWNRLSARSGDLLLSAALPAPHQPLWLVCGSQDQDSPLRVTDREPAAGSSVVRLASTIAGEAGDRLRLRLNADSMVRLGIARGQARDIGQILAAERITARQTIRREVRSELASVRATLNSEFAAIDTARERADKTLDEAERLRGHDAKRRQARAGEAALELCDEALKKLLACESVTGDYPELLRNPPPGQTGVGLTEQRLTLYWSTAFQSRRQGIADLRARATRCIEP